MSKILIIPDVHGRTFWRKAKEEISNVDRVVFLGDYLDPYFFEGITRENTIEEFKGIIKFKKENLDKVILLLGNHDESYKNNFGSATRYDYDNEKEIKSLFGENESLFRLFHKEGNYLFSHAGVTNHWLHTYFPSKSIDDFLSLKDEEIVPYLWVYSYYRGGRDRTGSMVWSDVREYDREPTFYQIFGHTQLESEPIITDKWACLDVRRCFLLDTENDKITDLINDQECLHP